MCLIIKVFNNLNYCSMIILIQMENHLEHYHKIFNPSLNNYYKKVNL
jgi:hypothetical protein